jgi:hypothetical protein
MNSKNIGPILQRLLRRIVVALVISLAAVLAGASLKVTNIQVLDQDRQKLIQTWKKQKADLNRRIDEFNSLAEAAQSHLLKAEADLAEARKMAGSVNAVIERGEWIKNWLFKWGKDWKDFEDQQSAKTAALAGNQKHANKALDQAENLVAESKRRFDEHISAKSIAEGDLQMVSEKLEEVTKWEDIQAEAIRITHEWARVIICSILLFVTPVFSWLRRTFVWFVPGAWVERRRKPLAFPEWYKAAKPIAVTSNTPSVELQLKADEVAWFRDSYIERTTRPKGKRCGILLIFSMKYWLMSLIDGLWFMTKINGDSEKMISFKVSDPEDSASEFAVVEIPAAASFIIRPHFIVGLTFPKGHSPVLRRHWRLTQLESWCVGQVCFFELAGPTRVVLRGARGVQSHPSVEDDSMESRLKPGSLIGFSPTVKLFVTRSENVWQYLANEDPFYNYSFEGKGTFLTNETQDKSHRSGPLNLLAGFGDLLLKLVGF